MIPCSGSKNTARASRSAPKRLWKFSFSLGLLLLISLTLAPAAGATEFLVTESGTFSANVPVTFVSAPDATWSYSFLVSSTPSPSYYSLGSGFGTYVSDFQYTLNGTIVPSAQADYDEEPGEVAWSSSAEGGLLDVIVQNASGGFEGFGLTGPQIYSGSESSPTLLAGEFPVGTGSEFVITTGFPDPTITYSEPVTGSVLVEDATPEPPAVLLMLTGLLALAIVGRRKIMA
jgi:hypothetical protein